MAKLVTVRLTANFERNLAEIEAFLAAVDAGEAFNGLIDELLETVVPNLERFPAMGRSFLERVPGSVEVVAAQSALRARLVGGDLREYLLKNYLVLYSLERDVIHLLAIRHHRQLSFDLARS